MTRVRATEAPTGIHVEIFILPGEVRAVLGSGMRLVAFETEGHDYHRLSWSKGDEGTVQINGHDYPVSEHAAFYARPGEKTVVRKESSTQTTGIPLTWLGEPAPNPGRHVFAVGDPAFEQLMTIRKALAKNIPADPATLLKLLTTSITNNPKVLQALDHINAHIANKPTPDQLTNLLQISPAHLRRLFQKSLNLSPQQAILQARLNAARYLLTTSTDEVSSIGRQLGFASHSTFTRLYREHFGSPPQKDRP